MKESRKRNKEQKIKKDNLKILKLRRRIGLLEFDHNQIPVDLLKLAHCNSYFLPNSYQDKPFTCVDCGSKECWTAIDQKWWYEEMKADINSDAIRCTKCRRKKRQIIREQKEHMEVMAQKPIHPNVAFFRRRY